MLVRRIIDFKKNHKQDSYLSSANFIIYGSKSKSSIVASLSDYAGGTVLELTPAGASSHLEAEYPNFISYPIQNLDELESVLDSLHADLTLMKKLSSVIEKLKVNPNDALSKKAMVDAEKAIIARGDNWTEVLEMATKGELPIKAICVAECNIISGWISERIESKMELEAIGLDKKKQGYDWSLLKVDLRKMYQKMLSLPCTTILSSCEIMPSEKQNVSAIIPSLTVGSFSRELIDGVGNVFYTTFEDGKYVAYINSDHRKILTKQKFKKIKDQRVLDEKIDITNEPEKLWKYIDNFRNEEIKK